MREEGRNGKRRKTLLWEEMFLKYTVLWFFGLHLFQRLWRLHFKSSQRRHIYFFENSFLINIFRELRSTFIGWLNLNKILWEILASVTTNTLLEFNFLSSIQLTTETHLWCHHNQSKSAWSMKTSKSHKRALQDGTETDPILSQTLHLTDISPYQTFWLVLSDSVLLSPAHP